jgi:hypothetical protein
VHWFVWDFLDTCHLCTFELGSEAIHAGLKKLSAPIPQDQLDFGFYNPPRLSATIDGNLSLVTLHTKHLKLEIWTHQHQKKSGDGATSADWLRTKVIDLNPNIPQIAKLSYMCLGERSDTFIILDGNKLVYIVNLGTSAVNDISSQFCTLRRYCWENWAHRLTP